VTLQFQVFPLYLRLRKALQKTTPITAFALRLEQKLRTQRKRIEGTVCFAYV
jgi:hypothetical protein